MIRHGLPALLALALCAPLAVADTIHLKNGAKFEGKIVSETDKVVVMKIRGLGPQTFKRKDVVKIERGNSIFDEYERRLVEIEGDDVEALWTLSQWCVENRLRPEAGKLYGMILTADPDHAGARRALGYAKVKDEWLNRAQLKKYREKRRKDLEAVLGGLELGSVRTNKSEGVSLRPPKGWKLDDADVLATVYRGPELHGITLLVAYEIALPESLDSFMKTVDEDLRSRHEDLTPVRADAPATLGRAVARMNVYRYGPGHARVERHDLFLEREEDSVHLWYVFPAEDADALSGLFNDVCVSFGEAETDLGGRAFTYDLPDTDWVHGFGLGQLDDAGMPIPDLPAGVEAVHHRLNPVLILMSSADRSGAEMSREVLTNLERMSATFRRDEGQKREVSGQPAEIVPYRGTIRTDRGMSVSIEGYSCFFSKGEKGYQILLFSMLGMMDERYLKKDFGRLLDSFKVP